MTYTEQAILMRPYIEKSVQSLPDADALQVKTLYPSWDALVKLGQVDTNGKDGYRFIYTGNGDPELYKCTQGNPKFQADWIPGIHTSALYVRIDESHAGTIADPIPAARGMEYEYGKYYLDPEDGKTYRCQRIGEIDGGKIFLAYLPHELIGQYFAEVAE